MIVIDKHHLHVLAPRYGRFVSRFSIMASSNASLPPLCFGKLVCALCITGTVRTLCNEFAMFEKRIRSPWQSADRSCHCPLLDSSCPGKSLPCQRKTLRHPKLRNQELELLEQTRSKNKEGRRELQCTFSFYSTATAFASASTNAGLLPRRRLHTKTTNIMS